MHENITLLEDFNVTTEDKGLKHSTDTFGLEHLINEPPCFKRIPSCTDLLTTNKKIMLQKYYCNNNWNI